MDKCFQKGPNYLCILPRMKTLLFGTLPRIRVSYLYPLWKILHSIYYKVMPLIYFCRCNNTYKEHNNTVEQQVFSYKIIHANTTMDHVFFLLPVMKNSFSFCRLTAVQGCLECGSKDMYICALPNCAHIQCLVSVSVW